jgi:hypothetical protein
MSTLLAILGLGKRCQNLMLSCLNLDKNIHVVAVCDDHGADAFNFFIQKLESENNPLCDAYKKAFAHVGFYPDSDEGLQKLFQDHKKIDVVFITGPNYKHFNHINAVLAYSSCKNMYIEKPLCVTLEEFCQYKIPENINTFIGLTLRYSTMAKIVVEKLQEYQSRLGALKKAKAWNYVDFCRALTSYMMGWRQYISLSGGLLHEKCIHDLDLALFFLQSLGIDPQNIDIKTEASHNFFKKSQKQMVIDYVLHNERIRKTLIGRDRLSFHRFIDFKVEEGGAIDWPSTINSVFAALPEDDSLDNSDIIPDYHKLTATIQSKAGSSIDFELEVKLGGLYPVMERGMHFAFENGVVEIDQMKSSMTIVLSDGVKHEFNLQTNNNEHADGDVYIAHTILGTLPDGCNKATFNDPIVRLATIMALISEHQALHKNKQAIQIKKIKNAWAFPGA